MTNILPSTCKENPFYFIIQARLSSKRLPEKVLKNIGSQNLLDHIIYRLTKIADKKNIIAAIPYGDDKLEKYFIENEIQTVNGDNKNVLSRFLLASQKIPDSSYIFRITGDNPFIDINAINLLYKHLLIKKADYSYTQNMPLGMGCEAFKKKALMNLNNEILLPHHKEHVTIYFRENSEKFRIAPLKMYKTNYAEIIRMTVDQNEDLKMAQKTYEYFQKQNLPRFGASEVIELFNTNREFFNWNNHISQNSALVYEK